MRVSAKLTYNCLLHDRDLLQHLGQRDTLLFAGLGREWQEIEKQVERLGFGEIYIVSRSGSRPGSTKVKPASAQ